ncbi:MAG: cell fate (sporulation/competence/biofilm development) regulator YlbF (YheA/YmcA/DUF963 family) [Verrucomicrobiales bacterium]|jgi:cell fate (sporulation/competence/biofilm development) regulator YlbF (YheA/YmcA/DUF963 family)
MSTDTLIETPSIEAKVRDLCEFIVNQPEFAADRGRIETFLEDTDAQKLFRAWQEKGQELHRMSHEGLQPNEEDQNEMDSLRQAVLANEVAAEFAGAEENMNTIFGTVTKLLQKTLQLGRVPTEADLDESGCCGGGGGGGCGCN